MKLAYGYMRREADFTAHGVEPAHVYIDIKRDRPLRDDLVDRAVREGDEVIVLFLRDLGGSPVADRVWRERIEAKGAKVVEIRPVDPVRVMGRPKKWKPDMAKEAAVREAWLGGGSEATRLRRAAERAGMTLGKGLLTGRFGTPSNPKPINDGEASE